MGRPRVQINKEELEKLAAMHCTVEEMAAFFGCSKDTLERRFAAVIRRGKEKGKSSLRRIQWELAQKGNTSMAIWLGKQLLNQKDKSVEEIASFSTISLKYSLDNPNGKKEPEAK